jgi:hypothetical protein
MTKLDKDLCKEAAERYPWPKGGQRLELPFNS